MKNDYEIRSMFLNDFDFDRANFEVSRLLTLIANLPRSCVPLDRERTEIRIVLKERDLLGLRFKMFSKVNIVSGESKLVEYEKDLVWFIHIGYRCEMLNGFRVSNESINSSFNSPIVINIPIVDIYMKRNGSIVKYTNLLMTKEEIFRDKMLKRKIKI